MSRTGTCLMNVWCMSSTYALYLGNIYQRGLLVAQLAHRHLFAHPTGHTGRNCGFASKAVHLYPSPKEEYKDLLSWSPGPASCPGSQTGRLVLVYYLWLIMTLIRTDLNVTPLTEWNSKQFILLLICVYIYRLFNCKRERGIVPPSITAKSLLY